MHFQDKYRKAVKVWTWYEEKNSEMYDRFSITNMNGRDSQLHSESSQYFIKVEPLTGNRYIEYIT